MIKSKLVHLLSLLDHSLFVCVFSPLYRLFTDLSYVLENSDYIVSILPSTQDTKGLLSGDVFKHCQHKVSTSLPGF